VYSLHSKLPCSDVDLRGRAFSLSCAPDVGVKIFLRHADGSCNAMEVETSAQHAAHGFCGDVQNFGNLWDAQKLFWSVGPLGHQASPMMFSVLSMGTEGIATSRRLSPPEGLKPDQCVVRYSRGFAESRTEVELRDEGMPWLHARKANVTTGGIGRQLGAASKCLIFRTVTTGRVSRETSDFEPCMGKHASSTASIEARKQCEF
jgi:hypothetical protein